MKKIVAAATAVLLAVSLTACGGDSGNAETLRTTVLETSSVDFETVHYYSISPDKTLWTELLEEDGSLTFSHTSLEGVYFNIGKNDLSAEDADVTPEELGEVVKSQCEEYGLTILSGDTVQIGGINWCGVTADFGDGETMQMLSTAKNGVQYVLNFFAPAESFEAALAEMNAALDTFEFAE